MNQFDFYDDELKKKEEEEARLRNAQQPPYGAGGGYYASGQVPDGNGAPYYTDGGDGNMNNGFGGGYYTAPPVPPQRSKSKKALWITLGCILLVVIFFVGYVVGHDVVRSDISILQTVLDTVEESSLYYDSSNWESVKRQMIVNGGTAMLQTIDGYGFLLSPAEYYTLLNPTATDEASYGMSYVKIDVGLYVHYVEYGSGAYLSGLQSGDLIIAATPLNGKKYDMRTSTDAEISQAFSGGWNTSVTLDVIRNLYTVSLGDTVSVTQITMKKVEYGGQFVEYYFGRGNTNLPNEMVEALGLDALDTATTGYIRINSFENASYYDGSRYVETDAASEFGAAMGKFRTAYGGQGKLVLDLVGNPGGNVEYAEDIAGYLCYDKQNFSNNSNLLVTTLKSRTGTLATYSTPSLYANYFDVNAEEPQIVVLTDGMSASASELLLGAMLDYGTAVHVGTTTYGKGIAQTIMPLEYYETLRFGDGSTMRYPYGIYFTAAMFYTPKNVNKHGAGFTPSEENRISDVADMVERAAELLE